MTVTTTMVDTARRRTRVSRSGTGEPVLFVHGNLSEGTVWREQLALLPDGFAGYTVDLRGFGEGDDAGIDATRGMGDHRDDIVALLDTLGLDAVHLVGHSMGGGVVADLTVHHRDRVRTLTLVAPVPPDGFGGTGPGGAVNNPDATGSGGGGANPELVRRIAAGDDTDEHPLSPRNVVRAMYFPPGRVVDEDLHTAAMLRTRIGDDHYPGDATPSPHWPGTGPGTRGVLNTMSPRYFSWRALSTVVPAVPVLWVYGDADVIVSDGSLSDVGHLGSVGAIPGWPGAAVFPPQPMIGQTREVIDACPIHREVVLAGTGHFPYAERPEEFARLLAEWLRGRSRPR